MNFRFSMVFTLLMIGIFSVNAQSTSIKVKIDGFEQDTLYLAVNYGKTQYMQDTAVVQKDGTFVFGNEEPFPAGIYLVVLPPDNNYFQVLITEEEQNFSLTTELAALSEKIEFEGSPENKLFYEYLAFLNKQGTKAESIKGELENLGEGDAKKEKLQGELENIDALVVRKQEEIVAQHPKSFTAAIVKANISIDMPDFEGAENEVREKQWRFTQGHYFDNIDLADQRMLRTPFLFDRIDFFVNKLQVRHPDTLANAVINVLEKMKPAEESFKYYLIHYLNEFANSKFVGMDAAYVALVEKYYATGQAPWTEAEQLEKIVDNAKALKPLLIGKIAPDLMLKTRAGEVFNLHGIESPYTVLYFWRYDCGVCKKSTPKMKEFFDNFKDKGVKLVAVCSKTGNDVPACWEYVDENEVADWIHAFDPTYRFSTVYNIKSTPQIYILNKDKEIISKRIAAEQLEEVMTQIIQMDSETKD